MLNQDKRIGGEAVHIRDCYVWAEIYYLDSPTNYCECLPQNPVAPRTIPESDLVMLDSSGNSLSSAFKEGCTIAGWSFIIVGLLLCLMLYVCA